MMKKHPIIMIVMILITASILSGCQEQNDVDNQYYFDNITLESRLLELVNASLEFIKENNVATRVDVKYLFHNIAGSDITIEVTVDFFDGENNLINKSQPKYISLLKDYTETGFAPENIISYSGENVSDVDHAKIIVI